MAEVSKSQKGRLAIRTFKTIADALALRGYYRPSGDSGQKLSEALCTISPEIYGSMNHPRIIELKGIEYAIDRLPRGIESCRRIVLTAQEELEGTSFERIEPLKRRRTSYRVSEREICFVITRGLSEIYDILTHLTFLNIEAGKIQKQIYDAEGNMTPEWQSLQNVIHQTDLSDNQLDQAIWNLSMILGRTYLETRGTYQYLDEQRRLHNSNSGLFQIVYSLGARVDDEMKNPSNRLIVYFTPALKEIIGHHKYGKIWSTAIKARLIEAGLSERPIHIISANLHSVVNVLYGYAAAGNSEADGDIYAFFQRLRDRSPLVKNFGKDHGLIELPDISGAHIGCQIIDTSMLSDIAHHPEFRMDPSFVQNQKMVVLVMDYAFGTQAFEVMDELLAPHETEDASTMLFDIRSVSVMGKAGILPGNKGDIMLATAHVLEGTAHNYIVENDLKQDDFDPSVSVFVGPILTVLGTSLQNRDVLERFQKTSWKAVGLEMEGGHYQKAISAAMIKRHISKDVKVRYAYYASDNPLISGQTLAYGSMGEEGIRPTYMITKVILEKILNPLPSSPAAACGEQRVAAAAQPVAN